ncbi:MAG: ParA family protein, partial [Desulfuromonadales bacterium]|nr:ParA family protein [Desulfuromonadales bacterium]NIS39679.1 ParA family protein [Desulfuromonadales bacterium]
MSKSFPFVVAVASEKGGVGKTTVSTNLAVFLKGLREDLPVAVASFDNHFSVDSMFAIGRHRGRSVADLFRGAPVADLMQMGQYGVEFMASDRRLTPPDDDVFFLRKALARSDLSGILVLDTRPILDYFTCSALLAADLILVPVKDRASLVNVASIRQTMKEIGAQTDRLWLVPSIIDRRLRLRGNMPLDRFLADSARERDYQVVDTFIAKSPKVEGLATNLSSRVYPVLTHARYTNAYRQFKELARFVLEHFDSTDERVCEAPAPESALQDERGGQIRRLAAECPVCHASTGEAEEHFFQDLRTRRRGFVHASCLQSLVEGTDVETFLSGGGILAVEMGVDDMVGDDGFVLHLFDAEGDKVGDEQVFFDVGTPWQGFLSRAAGRSTRELFRDVLLLGLDTAKAR